MATEIERKFLVNPEKIKELDDSNANHDWGFFEDMYQYYLTDDVRIRVIYARQDRFHNSIEYARTYMTMKIKSDDPMVREEIEHEVSHNFYRGLIFLDYPCINKTRYHMDNKWTIDVFRGQNTGLALAEIELETTDQEVVLPDWIGEEVTGDEKYYNSYLVKEPYCNWSK